MKAAEADQPVDANEIAMPAEMKAPAQASITDAEIARITNETGRKLAKFPKVRVRLPQTPNGQSQLPDETVQINGYTFQIKRGEWVNVPEPVAVILEQAGLI